MIEYTLLYFNFLQKKVWITRILFHQRTKVSNFQICLRLLALGYTRSLFNGKTNSFATKSSIWHDYFRSFRKTFAWFSITWQHQLSQLVKSHDWESNIKMPCGIAFHHKYSRLREKIRSISQTTDQSTAQYISIRIYNWKLKLPFLAI